MTKPVRRAQLKLAGFDAPPAAPHTPPAPVTNAPDVNTPAPPACAATSVAIAEVLSFCPRLLSDLPAATTLVCDRVANAGGLVITTSAAVYAAAGRARDVGWPVFTGTELAAMALAAEHDRGSPAAVEQWCDQKLAGGPAWRLTAAAALGPVAGRYDPRGWSIGRVFDRLGLVLRMVEVGDVDGAAGLARAGVP